MQLETPKYITRSTVYGLSNGDFLPPEWRPGSNNYESHEYPEEVFHNPIRKNLLLLS